MCAGELLYMSTSMQVCVCVLCPLCSVHSFFPSVLDYVARTFDLTFSSTISQVNISIPIIDDTSVEDYEHFFGTLHVQGTPVTVVASPDMATVVISEDPSDSKSESQQQWLFFCLKCG